MTGLKSVIKITRVYLPKKNSSGLHVASLGAGIALYVIATQQQNPVHTANMLDLLIPFFKDISIPLSITPLRYWLHCLYFIW